MTQDFDTDRKTLQHVLEVYGADRSRWPSASRAQLDRLLEADAASRRLYAEARALDRVLDRAAHHAKAPSAGLADRIAMAAAATASLDAARDEQQVSSTNARVAEPAAPSKGGRVIALPLPWRRPAQPQPDDVLTGRTAWQSAALIAASLLVGLYIGAGSTVLPIMQDVAESVGIVAELDVRDLSGLDDLGDEESL